MASKEVQVANSDAQIKSVPSDMVFIALVAVLLLLALAAHEGRKSFTSLAIVLGVVALIACVVYGIRALDIGLRTRTPPAVAAPQQQHDPPLATPG